MPTNAEYMRRWRAEHKAENAEKRKEYRAKYAAKKKAAEEQKRAELTRKVLDEIEVVPEFAEAATATRINEKYKLTHVCGATYRGKRCFIVERVSVDKPNRYRIKETVCHYFPSLAEVKEYADSRSIHFIHLVDIGEGG